MSITTWTIDLPPGRDTKGIENIIGPAIEVAVGVREDSAYLAVGGSGVLDELARAISNSANAAQMSRFPAECLIDLQGLLGGIEGAGIGVFREPLSQMKRLGVPTHIRWAAIPINGGGDYRTQISSGAFFALARGFAQLSEAAQTKESASVVDHTSVDTPGAP